ncbi:hypothetical protein GHT06_009034 [Daphnia sinensis]|uniref:Uncharacterized protein n=1 Tax=Daphnia sinensis TaxID=1820382 RepID=A0AAD5L2C9_9CRUS|nr:hypothetical protein GHT06_009034 [Daphnia sinensis]
MADIKSQLSALVKRDLEEDDAEDFGLPITNASDLEKVNSAISTSKKAYKILYRQLDSVGGRGPSHIVNEMMRKLLHRETLAKTMTWKKTPEIQEMDVKKHGGSWLLHCKDTKKKPPSAKPSDTAASRKNDCASTSAWKPDDEDLV